VLRVTLDGEVSEFLAFDNTVATGLAVSGNAIYMAEAGPVPHLPADGKVSRKVTSAVVPPVLQRCLTLANLSRPTRTARSLSLWTG
jgi:hypothetical protein